MKTIALLLALVTLTGLARAAHADTIEERAQTYWARQKQAREQEQLNYLAKQRRIFVQKVLAFAKRHSGAAGEPTCEVQMAGDTISQTRTVQISAAQNPPVVFIDKCVVYLNNGLACNVIVDPLSMQNGSKVSAGCYDDQSNYHQLK